MIIPHTVFFVNFWLPPGFDEIILLQTFPTQCITYWSQAKNPSIYFYKILDVYPRINFMYKGL